MSEQSQVSVVFFLHDYSLIHLTKSYLCGCYSEKSHSLKYLFSIDLLLIGKALIFLRLATTATFL